MILVVGSSGLLGGMITRRLLQQGKAVRILTRSNPAYQSLIEAGAQPITGDLKDRLSLDPACQGIDTVITTASSANRSGDDNQESVNLNGTINLFEAAEDAGVKRCIYISVYGSDPNSQVVSLRCKGLCEQYLRNSALPYTILRPNSLLEVWLRFVIGIPLEAGQPITLAGKGVHRHSFIAAQDVAAFAVASVDNPTARNKTINLGQPESITWTEFVQRVGIALGKELPINYVPIGTPIPLLPETMSAVLNALETYETCVDSREASHTYGVKLTPIEEVATSVFNIRPERS